MTEREKQLAGLAYDGADPELKGMQYRAQDLVRAINALPMADEEGRAKWIADLFGRAGRGLRVVPPLHVDFGCNIETGEDVFINQNCTFLDTNRIVIGSRVLIGPDVRIYAADHPLEGSARHRRGADGKLSIVTSARPVIIGDDVWIGGGSIVLPGVTVGNNVVIGAGSVVTRDVPDNVVAAGNPCSVLRVLESPGQSEI